MLQHCEAIFADKDLPKDQSLWLGVVLAKVKPGKYSMQVEKTKRGEYGILIGEEVDEPSGPSEKEKVR